MPRRSINRLVLPGHPQTLHEQCTGGHHVREPWWTEAAAVGSEAWVRQVAGCLPGSRHGIERAPAAGRESAEGAGTYLLRLSNRAREGFLGMLPEGDA